MRTELEILQKYREIENVQKLASQFPVVPDMQVKIVDTPEEAINWERTLAREQPALYELYRNGVMHGRKQALRWVLGVVDNFEDYADGT